MLAKCAKLLGIRPKLRLRYRSRPANDDDTSIRYLPPPRANFGDKLIYLKFSGLPLFGQGTDYADHDEWVMQMQQELPAFLYYLRCEHEIDDERYCRNYRAGSYHNPDLVRSLQSQGQPAVRRILTAGSYKKTRTLQTFEIWEK